MSKVYISEEFEPNVPGIKAAIRAGCEALPEAKRLLAGCATALVKPNLVNTFNHEKATTNPAVIDGVIAALHDYGISDITVGEGCGMGRDAHEVFEATGVAAIARRHGAKLVDLNKSEQVELPARSRLLLDSVKVAREVVDADLLVNVPILKTHSETMITVAMKNLKGVINWPQKRSFHRQGLYRSIVDLSSAMPEHLIVVDATRGMEGFGPFIGDLISLNRMLVGTDALAVDIVATLIMGFGLDEVPTVQLAIEAGLGSAEPEVVGASIASVREAIGRPFKRPFSGPALEPEFAAFHLGETTCSGCQAHMHGISTLTRDQYPWLPSEKLIDFYAGDVAATLPPAPRVAVVWGSCAVKEARKVGLEKGRRCLFVPGCPPDPGTSFPAFESIREHLE